MLEYQNIRMFLQKASFQIGRKKLVKIGLNELLEKIKIISTKGLKKDLIDKLSILNRAEYFL